MGGVGRAPQGRYRRNTGVGPRVRPAAPAVGWKEQSGLLPQILYARGEDMEPGPECGYRQAGDIQPPLDVGFPIGPLHLGKYIFLKGVVEETPPFSRKDIGTAFCVLLDVAGAGEICDLRLGKGGF